MRVTLEGVTYSYGTDSRTVLKCVTIDVPAGESIAILGPSGAGKSTLLRIVAGFLDGSKRSTLTGTVRLNGMVPHDLDIKTRDRVGFAFQEPFLLPFLTVQENLTLSTSLARRSPESNSAPEALSRIGLFHDRKKWPHQLSGGMRTRLALARELLLNPSLLLLDEPFGALDAVWKLSLYKLVSSYRMESSATLLLVTHDITEAILLCERVVILSPIGDIAGEVSIGGRKPNLNDPQETLDFLSSKAPEQALLIRLLEHQHPSLDVVPNSTLQSR